MEIYIGTKTIEARQCTAEEAAGILGRDIDTSNADAEGNGYLVRYEDSYQSWSPAEPFEKAYRLMTDMTFGMAIEALKLGKKVARAGWNGKGMYLAIQKGSVIGKEAARGGIAKCLAEDGHNEITVLPHIDMKSAQGEVVVGWLASQTDILSEDWQIVE